MWKIPYFWPYLFLLESSRNSHLPMAPPPLVFHFIGTVFTAVLYGKLSNNIRLRWQLKRCTLCHRFLLPGICLILANPTQESKWTERISSLRAHFKFYSVHDLLRHLRNPDSVWYHRESYTSRIFCSDVMFNWFSNLQKAVLKVHSLDNALSWIVIAQNCL